MLKHAFLFHNILQELNYNYSSCIIFCNTNEENLMTFITHYVYAFYMTRILHENTYAIDLLNWLNFMNTVKSKAYGCFAKVS